LYARFGSTKPARSPRRKTAWSYRDPCLLVVPVVQILKLIAEENTKTRIRREAGSKTVTADP
jgi:hypothetical protein